MTALGHVVIVTFTTLPEHRDRFRTRVMQQAQDSLALEPRCSVFDVCLDRERPDIVVLYEVYDDVDAFTLHVGSAHYKDFASAVGGWIADKQVLQLQRLR